MTDGTPLHNEGPASAAARSAGIGERLPSLGPRGEGWVALQAALLSAVTASGRRGAPWPRATRALRLAVAGPAALAGAALFFGGGGKLGRQLTPFPRPVDGAALRRDGVYGVVRHPIYGGLLLLTLAWALVTSPAALPPWAATVIFFDAKRRREEVWLAERHADYDQYRAQVPHALLPYVW